jgi:ATP synthase F1 complex assembly factor 2
VSDILHIGQYQVMLDKRPLRTPNKAILQIPRSKRHLAAAIALEWEVLTSASQALRPHMIPLTSIASRAVTVEEEDRDSRNSIRAEIVENLLGYLDTDAVVCLAPETDHASSGPKSLREIQEASAVDIISFLTSTVWPGIHIELTSNDSIVPKKQSVATRDVIRGWMTGLNAYDLVGLERAVLATKSLLIASRLVASWSGRFKHVQTDEMPEFGIDEAAEAANHELQWQMQRWGEVEGAHDVADEDMKRQLGSVILLVSDAS